MWSNNQHLCENQMISENRKSLYNQKAIMEDYFYLHRISGPFWRLLRCDVSTTLRFNHSKEIKMKFDHYFSREKVARRYSTRDQASLAMINSYLIIKITDLISEMGETGSNFYAMVVLLVPFNFWQVTLVHRWKY